VRARGSGERQRIGLDIAVFIKLQVGAPRRQEIETGCGH